MALEIPTALERRIEIRNEFYHEAPRFTNAVSPAMKTFILDRLDYILDEYNALALIPVQKLTND